jgi:hypothetical protein
LTTALRISRVISTSLFAFDCWPAVIAPGARSLMLTAELSGAAGGESCAIVTVPCPKSANDRIKVSAIRFNDDYLQFV